MPELDEHGQPHPAINYRRNLTKATESLLGLCRGLLADQRLSAEEIVFLDTWLRENEIVEHQWPGSVIAERVRQVMADGVVSTEESEDLQQTLEQILGGGFDEGVVSGNATSLPLDDAEAVEVDGSTFCFTGKFIFGPRRKCEDAVVSLGGEVAPRVTKAIDYLVIGALASRDWAHTSHGRKIEAALDHKEKGREILIIGEEMWADHISRK
ncbi:NAD-dependent DNA ligase [Ectothiorhodospiraceae bacterium WFHF3C12]|nr:NAD-dependent DNA ligase [Ectothiorhodospiraceae bacterium WFHF3C12]